MKTSSHERGQALILIVFAIVALVGMTGLAVDGGMAYNDRRNAQNAADGAALAAALGDVRGRDITSTALSAAATAGYNDAGLNTVTVSIVDLPLGTCPNTNAGKDITVQITSVVNTYFAPVLGIRSLTNTVLATARECAPFIGPLFKGNAIVALGPSGIGFDGTGNPNWDVSGGGIFSNSTNSPSARCKGAASLVAPSLTTVGTVDLACSNDVPSTSTGTLPYTYASYSDLLPTAPTCNGQARKEGAFWVADSKADGSTVVLSGNMAFGSGLYCVTNSPGPYHGTITGQGVTFYIVPANFDLKFAGGGTLGTPTDPISAPTAGDYKGVLFFSTPQLVGGVLQNTQAIDLRGNGNGYIYGSIIMPSASVTMFGNSSGTGYSSQIIGYNVNSGGTSDINIHYDASGGYQTLNPALITLLR